MRELKRGEERKGRQATSHDPLSLLSAVLHALDGCSHTRLRLELKLGATAGIDGLWMLPFIPKATRAWTFSEYQKIRSSRNWERVAVADPIGRDGKGTSRLCWIGDKMGCHIRFGCSGGGERNGRGQRWVEVFGTCGECRWTILWRSILYLRHFQVQPACG